MALLISALKGPPWMEDLFPLQQRVMRSQSRRKAICCSRRAGKTVTAASGLASALEEAEFDEAVVYAARTRGIAKRLIWAKLRKVARDHKRAWEFSETELTVTNERGGFVIVVGLDKPAEIEKLRGLKIRRFIGDEPATYSALLEDLYDEILEPACADLDGDIWLMGTPGPILQGFWYDVARERKPGEKTDWERHHWTMFDNPHMRDPEGFLSRVLQRKGWARDNAVVQREYFGKWSADDDAQVYRYLPSRNDVSEVPGYNETTRDQWVHAIGVDFGMTDSCAWAVLASHRHASEVYVVKAFKRVGLRPEQAADVTRKLVETYKPYVLVGDSGGLGKPYVAAYNDRHYAGSEMVAADKLEKRAHIELINDDIRSGRLKLLMPECQALATEMEHLPWADDARLKEHPAYDNHCCDASLYAWRHHRAFMHRPAEPKVQPRRTPDSDEWIRREEERYRQREDADSEWWSA